MVSKETCWRMFASQYDLHGHESSRVHFAFAIQLNKLQFENLDTAQYIMFGGEYFTLMFINCAVSFLQSYTVVVV
jgi:hypothetical protein